jgi:hypothetical protein
MAATIDRAAGGSADAVGFSVGTMAVFRSAPFKKE